MSQWVEMNWCSMQCTMTYAKYSEYKRLTQVGYVSLPPKCANYLAALSTGGDPMFIPECHKCGKIIPPSQVEAVDMSKLKLICPKDTSKNDPNMGAP